MIYDQNNIFAKILRNEIPATVVYDDEFALAFHDANPKAPTHILVIPKGEFISFYDFTMRAKPEMIVGFNRAILKVIQLENLQDNGFRLLSNHGEHGMQQVPHYHVHIFGGRFLGPMLTP